MEVFEKFPQAYDWTFFWTGPFWLNPEIAPQDSLREKSSWPWSKNQRTENGEPIFFFFFFDSEGQIWTFNPRSFHLTPRRDSVFSGGKPYTPGVEARGITSYFSVEAAFASDSLVFALHRHT